MKFAEVTTTAPNPGPNPVVTIEGLSYDESTGVISGRFVSNEDAKMMKYFSVTSSDATLYSACALNDLVTTQRRDYNTYMNLWENQIMELGLSTNAESVAFTEDVDKNSTAPVLIAAIAIGEDDGVDVYSPIVAKIWHKGELKDLADFRTPPTE